MNAATRTSAALAVMVFLGGALARTQAAEEYHRGACYSDAATPQETIDSCSALLDQAGLHGKERALVYVDRGLGYMALERRDEAIADFTAALRIDPNDQDAYANRGTCYHDDGKLELAMADYDRALILDPKDAITLFNRGISYHERGEDVRAIGDFDQSIAIDPSNAEAYGNRGLAELGLGKTEPALADFTHALSMPTKYADEVYVSRAVAYFRLGRLREAADDDAQVVAMPASPYAPYALIDMHVANLWAGVDDHARFDAAVTQLHPTGWPGLLIAFLAARATVDQVELDATTPMQRCEAAAVIAAWQHAHGQDAAARTRLAREASVCPGLSAPP